MSTFDLLLGKALPILIAVAAITTAGCADYGNVLRDRGPGSHRYDVNRDVSRYVAQVDRHVRLNRREERGMARLLQDRTYRLLERTRPADRRYVYPFPRRDYRRMNDAQFEFWRDVDRTIERNLPRTQARRYADLTGRRDDRYRRSDRPARRETRRHR